MKLNLTLVGVLALILVASFVANAEDTLTFDSTLTSELSQAEQKNTMTWPMLPGESVSDLARMFYPNNKTMQQQFVAKTLKLSSDVAPNLKATERFKEPTLLVIPTLKSLSKKAVYTPKKTNKSLKMSYGLKQAIENVSEKLLREYEELIGKNEFLKQELAKLKEKIIFLENKLGELKLIFDKTLTLSGTSSDLAKAEVPSNTPDQNINLATATKVPESAPPVASNSAPMVDAPVAKKVFKNLNIVKKPVPPLALPEPSTKTPFLEYLDSDLVKAALIVAVLLLLGAFGLKKYRERMFAQLSFASTKMQNTVTDFSGYFEKTKLVVDEVSQEAVQQQQAAKEVETRLSTTLEEAKLLMSVNRATDAIEHLKMTIQSQPKASLNHWLYLLEVYRKLNLKSEFEEYAEGLHETFNVMTPVWYEKEAATAAVMVVPQSLEEFPHIMEQLYGVWPGELATVYLRSLITDNRGGERVGFGKTVVSEILLLIALLDTHKDLPD